MASSQTIASRSVALTPVTTCRDAINAIWPIDTRDMAIKTLTLENGAELPGRISAVNNDGQDSRDHGCMQINDYWHYKTKGWNNFNDIYDPVYNVKYALQIYQAGNTFKPWYSVCTPGKEVEGIRCKQ